MLYYPKCVALLCQQIWKTQQWPQNWKRLIFIQIPKKGSTKECTNYQTIAHPNAYKVMLKILQARHQYYFFIYFFKFYFIFRLYNFVLILPNIEMNSPQVYMCSPSWTLLPPPSAYHPSGSSQCTSPKHPISCIEPGLATRSIYDIIRISMPFSHIIPPSASPTESKRLFYTSVSLLLSRI